MFFYYPSWLKSMHLGFDAAQVYNWIIFLMYILVIQLCSHMYIRCDDIQTVYIYSLNESFGTTLYHYLQMPLN